jgi:hypothetical protein
MKPHLRLHNGFDALAAEPIKGWVYDAPKGDVEWRLRCDVSSRSAVVVACTNSRWPAVAAWRGLPPESRVACYMLPEAVPVALVCRRVYHVVKFAVARVDESAHGEPNWETAGPETPPQAQWDTARLTPDGRRASSHGNGRSGHHSRSSHR